MNSPQLVQLPSLDLVYDYTYKRVSTIAMMINCIPDRDIIYTIEKRKSCCWVLFQTRYKSEGDFTVCFQFEIYREAVFQDIDRMVKYMERLNEVWSRWALEDEMGYTHLTVIQKS